MNAFELLMPDGKPSSVFVCEKCSNVASSLRVADACCAPTLCRVCEKPSGRQHYAMCEPCQRIEDAAKERALFDKAEKLTHDDGPFFTPGGDFFSDIDAIEDKYADADPEDMVKPEYVWCAKQIKFRLDVSGDLQDQMHNDLHEDAS